MYPILFQFGPVTIKTYGVFLIAGVAFSVFLFSNIAHKKRLNLDFISDNLVYVLISILVFSRTVYVAANFSTKFKYNLKTIFFIWDSNMDFFGGVVGFLFIFFILSLKKNQKIWKWLDAVMLSVLPAFILSDIGSLFNGMGYGTPSSLPWPFSITFFAAEVRYAIPIYNTQLFSAILTSIIFLFLFISKKNWKQNGTLFLTGSILYSASQGALEFLRGNPVPQWGFFRMPQVFYFVFLVLSIICLYYKSIYFENGNGRIKR